MIEKKQKTREIISVKKIMIIATSILLIPIVMMQISDEWDWRALDFVFAWVMFTGAGLSYRFLTKNTNNLGKRIAIGTIVLAVLLLIWVQFI